MMPIWTAGTEMAHSPLAALGHFEKVSEDLHAFAVVPVRRCFCCWQKSE